MNHLERTGIKPRSRSSVRSRPNHYAMGPQKGKNSRRIFFYRLYVSIFKPVNGGFGTHGAGWEEKIKPPCYYLPFVWVIWNIITGSFCSISTGHKHFSCHGYLLSKIDWWKWEKCRRPEITFLLASVIAAAKKIRPASALSSHSPEGPELRTEMRGFEKFQYIQEKLSILALYVVVILCLLIIGNYWPISLNQ